MVLTIENADNKLLEILNALNAYTTKPYKIIKTQDYKLSSADEKELKKRVKKYEKGELEFVNLDEAVEHSNNYLRKLGAKI